MYGLRLITVLFALGLIIVAESVQTAKFLGLRAKASSKWCIFGYACVETQDYDTENDQAKRLDDMIETTKDVYGAMGENVPKQVEVQEGGRLDLGEENEDGPPQFQPKPKMASSSMRWGKGFGAPDESPQGSSQGGGYLNWRR